ncbi:hypothetical protein V8C26DRAFT_58880 [Trichoderma gracile]
MGGLVLAWPNNLSTFQHLSTPAVPDEADSDRRSQLSQEMGLESSGRLHHTSFSCCDCNCSVTALQCALGAVENPLGALVDLFAGSERYERTAWWRLLACLLACLFACSCVFSPLVLIPPPGCCDELDGYRGPGWGSLGGLDLDNGRMMRQCRRREWSGRVEAAGGCTVGQRREVAALIPFPFGWTGRCLFVVLFLPPRAFSMPCFACCSWNCAGDGHLVLVLLASPMPEHQYEQRLEVPRRSWGRGRNWQ